MSAVRMTRSHGAYGSSTSLSTPAASPEPVGYSTALTSPLGGGLGAASPTGACVLLSGGSSGSSSAASTPASARRGRVDKSTLAEFVFRAAAPPTTPVALCGNWTDWEPLPMAVMEEVGGGGGQHWSTAVRTRGPHWRAAPYDHASPGPGTAVAIATGIVRPRRRRGSCRP